MPTLAHDQQPPSADPDQAICGLDRLAPGQSGVVVGIDAEPGLRRRLMEMGFTPGTTVHLLRRAPLGDPLTVRLRGYHLSLRAAQARHLTLVIGSGPETPAAPLSDTTALVTSAPASGPWQRVALIGNPNAGKTTVFNALTGLRQKVANYPGVTVERRSGRLRDAGQDCEILDLPGTYSLAPFGPDERIAVEVLNGRQAGEARPDAVIAVVDAANLPRNLLLLSQVLDLGLPTVVALTMTDLAEQAGKPVDHIALASLLGVPVVPLVAHRRRGIDELREALGRLQRPLGRPWQGPDLLLETSRRLGGELAELAGPILGAEAPDLAAERLLTGAESLVRYASCRDERLVVAVERSRRTLAEADLDPVAIDLDARYRWIDAIVSRVAGGEGTAVAEVSWRRRVDAILLHRGLGLGLFALIMSGLFVLVFLLAPPLSDLIETGLGLLQTLLADTLPAGPVVELLGDGIIAGVGAVLVFVPPIALLFLALALLEDSGYLARAATLLDRVLARFGLSGAGFVPLLSAHACAIPAVMAARNIASPRERLVTILVAPFMTCSARLPVYLLLVGLCFGGYAFWIQGLIYCALYAFAILTALGMALIASRLLGRRIPSTPFLLEVPPLRLPQLGSVLRSAGEHSWAFVRKAFTVIFACSIILWVLCAYPRTTTTVIAADGSSSEVSVPVARAETFAGRFGHAIEPAIAPLGYDWKMGIGLLAAFGAREAFVGTMGIVYSIGEDEGSSAEAVEDEAGIALLNTRMREDTRVVGSDAAGEPITRPVWTVPVGLSLLVFFALAMQCMSTLAVVRKETGSWRWPLVQIVLMTGLAWIAAFATYRIALAATGGAA